jgi:hypothetical protein
MTFPRRLAPPFAAPCPPHSQEGGQGRRTALLTAAPLAAALCALILAASAQATPVKIAGYGQGAGKVNGPDGVAVNQTGAGGVEAGTLYVADYYNRRIDRFGPSGEFELGFGMGVADGRSLELQVCGPEAEPPTLRCFERSGDHPFNISVEGGAGAMQPYAVAIDQSTGDVYVEGGNYRVQAFGPSGEFLRAFGAGVVSGGAAGTGDIEAGSNIVRAVSVTHKAFLTGQQIAGPGIQPGTVVKLTAYYGFGEPEPKLVLSKPATATDTGVALTSPEGAENLPQNEVQMLAIDPGVSGGELKLRFAPPEPEFYSGAETTAGIPFDAAPAEVQTALAALPSVGPGNVSVTSPNPGGGAEPGGPYAIEFKGERWADTNVAQLSVSTGEPALSGGGASVETTQDGAAAAEICTVAADCVRGTSAPGPGQFSISGMGLAFDSSGDLWVAGKGRLQRFAPDGSFVEQVALPAGAGSAALAIDPTSDDFYLLGSGSVQRVDPTGALLKTLDEGGTPRALAVDSEGNVYVGDCGSGCSSYRFMEFNPAGEQVSQFGAGQAIGQPTGNALAVDEASASLFVASSRAAGTGTPPTPAEEAKVAVQRFDLPEPGPLPDAVRAEDLLPTSATLAAQLDPENHPTTYHFEYDSAPYEEGEEDIGTSPPHGTAVPVPEATLAASGFDPEEVQAGIEGLIPSTAYHARLVATNHCNDAEPAEECTVYSEDATFTTRPAVAIEAQWVSEVSARNATLNARLDPLGVEGKWWIEYGTSAAYGSETAKASLPASFGDIHLATAFGGLSPATTYHYRFAASDERDGAAYVVHGADRSFVTQSADLNFSLADSRAWEMVTPAKKHGGLILPGVSRAIIAAEDGNGLAYLSLGPVEADPEGNRSIDRTSNLARRGVAGSWSSADMTPPSAEASPSVNSRVTPYTFFSSDLSRAILEPNAPTPLSPYASERTPYVRDNTDPPTYTPLVSGCPPAGQPCPPAVEEHADVPPGTMIDGSDKSDVAPVVVQGVDSDLSHVVFDSGYGHLGHSLLDGVPKDALYEWSAGHLQVVTVTPTAEGEEPIGGEVGSHLGSSLISVRHTVSADGSRIFWSAYGPSALYVRDTVRGETLRLDLVHSGIGLGKPEPFFQDATSAGDVAFFSDIQQLTEDASETGADLYRCEIVVEGGSLACRLTDLTGGTNEPNGVAEPRTLGIAEDGSRVYFVARGVLDQTPNGSGEAATPGQPNLYVWREGEGNRYIATLSEGDGNDWGADINLDSRRTAFVSPDGRYLAFMSERRLTGYDNRDALTGERDQEVFRYDTATETLACLSCNPSGARPSGALDAPQGEALAVDVGELWQGRALAADLPQTRREGLGKESFYFPRAVHDDGRVFFNAVDALVPADSNGTWDVYEYEPGGVGSCNTTSGGAGTVRSAGGCVSLISSGAGDKESAFLDASVGGNDVFFLTAAQLSVTDEDHEADIYDARVGGVAATRVPSVECLGEACQPPVSPPALQTPASASFEGRGNPVPTRSCARSAHRLRIVAHRNRALRHRIRQQLTRVHRLHGSPAATPVRRRAHRLASLLVRRVKAARRLAQHTKRCRRHHRRAPR